MIRMLHIADLHLGVENYGQLDAASGLHTRLLDYLARLDEAIDGALDAGVDLVLIAGDTYKNRTPNPTHQREFARRIHRLRSAGLPVFILTGNHDVSPSHGRAHAVEIFTTLELDGVIVADRPGVFAVPTPAGTLQVVALPWVTRHNLLSTDDLRLVPFAEVETMLLDRIERFVEAACAELDPYMPTVLAMHGTLFGATYGAERSLMLGQDLVIPRSAVAHPLIDYIALGHIHKHQQVGEHPPAVYSGSLERIDFGEEHEAKGYVLVELEKGQARWRFVEVAARPFVTLHVDVRNSSDPLGRVLEAIRRRDLHDAVTRVTIDALPEQCPALREEEIRKALGEGGAAVIAAVAVDVVRPTRTRLGASQQELVAEITPLRALELYLRGKDTPAERMRELLAAAERLIATQQGRA